MCLFPFSFDIWKANGHFAVALRVKSRQVAAVVNSRDRHWRPTTSSDEPFCLPFAAITTFAVCSTLRQSRQFVTLSRNHWFCGFLLQTQILELFQLKKFFSSCSQFLFVCCLILKLSLSFCFADNLCTSAQRFAVIFLYLFCSFFSHFPFLVWVWR